MDPIKFSVRSSFFDWPDFYLIDIQTREMHPGLSKKKVSSHHSRCRYRDGCRWLFFRSGQYNLRGDFWKQFLLRATKSCLPESLPLQRGNPARRRYSHAIAHLDRRSRSCELVFASRGHSLSRQRKSAPNAGPIPLCARERPLPAAVFGILMRRRFKDISGPETDCLNARSQNSPQIRNKS